MYIVKQFFFSIIRMNGVSNADDIN